MMKNDFLSLPRGKELLGKKHSLEARWLNEPAVSAECLVRRCEESALN